MPYSTPVPTIPAESPKPLANRYNRRLRRVFYLAALSSIRTNGPSNVRRARTQRTIITAKPLRSPRSSMCVGVASAIFHCYIDLLWAKWQPNHTTDTDLDARLCRLFKDRDHLEEHCIHVNDTLNGEGVVGVARGPAVLDDRDGDEVLQGISFTASPGRMVALVGSSGVRLRP